MEEVKAIPYKDIPGVYHLRWSDGTWSEGFYNEIWANEHCRRLNAEYNASVGHTEARTDVSTGTKVPPYLTTFKRTSDDPRGSNVS